MTELPPSRGHWVGRFDFLISMIAYAVGLGNVWRFPYLCFKNGGGAFLLAYAVFWVFAAVPIFLLEVTLGQLIQRGGIEVWRICPIFKGVGLANLTITCLCASYYCVIVTWALYYMICSLQVTFPWEYCGNWWNTANCISTSLMSNKTYMDEIIGNRSNSSKLLGQTSVEQFWDHRVLQRTNSIGDLGGIQYELLLANVCTWVFLYFALWQGITKARKMVYICALTPYLLLLILLVRGVTLPGAIDGLYLFLVPDLSKLLTAEVWKDAGTQVFYSYGVGYGTLMALGSHNPYHHNCYRDSLLMCVINGCTSMLAGTVVFSILGYMAHMAGVPVQNVVKSGVGLAFLTYPEVVAILPLKQVWSVLLFLVLCILGMDTQICLVEGAITSLEDTMPSVLRKHRKLFLFVFCASAALLGVPMAGTYWLTLVDAYGASGIALLFIVLFEVVGIAWFYGAQKVHDGMEDMLGYRPSKVWIFAWKFTAPASCLILFTFLLYNYEPLRYANGEPYPQWATNFGTLLSLLSMSMIPGYGAYYLLFVAEGDWKTRLRMSVKEVAEGSDTKCGETEEPMLDNGKKIDA